LKAVKKCYRLKDERMVCIVDSVFSLFPAYLICTRIIIIVKYVLIGFTPIFTSKVS